MISIKKKNYYHTTTLDAAGTRPRLKQGHTTTQHYRQAVFCTAEHAQKRSNTVQTSARRCSHSDCPWPVHKARRGEVWLHMYAAHG